MKISKYFMVAAASIMMFGCAKNDGVAPALEGKVVLTLNFVSPTSKAEEDAGTEGEEGVDKIAVGYSTFDVKVTGSTPADYAGEGTALGDGWQQFAAGTTPTVYVEDPTLVEVRINGGKNSYAFGDLNGLQSTAATAMAAYGSTGKFTRESGGTTEVGGVTYDLYRADVTLSIPVARLEVSGIQHVDNGEKCEYSALSLDNYTVRGVPSTVTYNAGFAAGTGTENFVEQINVSDFLTTGVTYPTTDGNVYGCYILPTQAPMLQFVLTGTIDGYITNENRYATVKTINGIPYEDFSFEAGKIYRITDVQISDDDMGSSEDGETAIALNIHVDVDDWDIVDTTVEF